MLWRFSLPPEAAASTCRRGVLRLRARIASAGQALGQVATAHAVTEVNYHPDDEPNNQPPPRRPRERSHESEGGDRACRCDEPDPRRGEFARQIWLAHTQHQDS